MLPWFRTYPPYRVFVTTGCVVNLIHHFHLTLYMSIGLKFFLFFLGIRTDLKENIQDKAAQLVYGSPLRLHSEFVSQLFPSLLSSPLYLLQTQISHQMVHFHSERNFMFKNTFSFVMTSKKISYRSAS